VLERVVCVLPSRDEAETIEQVLSDLIATLSKVEGVKLEKIILSDDSIDQTREISRNFELVEIIDGGGALGRAMYRGLKRSLKYNPDIILSLDSDGQLDMQEVVRFIEVFRKDEVDLLLGSRFIGGDLIDYKYPFINKIGVVLLSTFLSIATGKRVTDSHGGLRVMRRKFVEAVKVAGSHTYVQETIIYAAKKGFKFKEVESVWLLRKSGGSRVVGNIPKYIVRTLPYMLYRSDYDLRLILPASVVFIIYANYLQSNLLYFLGTLLLVMAVFLRILGMRGDRQDALSA